MQVFFLSFVYICIVVVKRGILGSHFSVWTRHIFVPVHKNINRNEGEDIPHADKKIQLEKQSSTAAMYSCPIEAKWGIYLEDFQTSFLQNFVLDGQVFLGEIFLLYIRYIDTTIDMAVMVFVKTNVRISETRITYDNKQDFHVRWAENVHGYE